MAAATVLDRSVRRARAVQQAAPEPPRAFSCFTASLAPAIDGAPIDPSAPVRLWMAPIWIGAFFGSAVATMPMRHTVMATRDRASLVRIPHGQIRNCSSLHSIPGAFAFVTIGPR